MEFKQKLCAIIEFLKKEGCRMSNIQRRLQNDYRDETIDKSNVHSWRKTSKGGETNTEDKPRSGSFCTWNLTRRGFESWVQRRYKSITSDGDYVE